MPFVVLFVSTDSVARSQGLLRSGFQRININMNIHAANDGGASKHAPKCKKKKKAEGTLGKRDLNEHNLLLNTKQTTAWRRGPGST